MANPFVHIELNTTDRRQAKEFYSQLFDWDLSDTEMGGNIGTYTMIKVGDGTGGGIMKHPMGGPTLWIPYVQVDDLAAATKKAKDLGAKMIKENEKVGEMGALTIFTDPTGGTLGLWQVMKK